MDSETNIHRNKYGYSGIEIYLMVAFTVLTNISTYPG